MCGITGFYCKQNSSSQIDALDNSINALKKRGPNAQGNFLSSDSKIGLGHARLSIIDTSEGANQPMISFDNKYVLVFNGEIFNYKALREGLISKGYQFKTQSDTEVVLNLFHAYGQQAWIQLNGFFAIAILEIETNELTLVRDRFGIKPLSYCFENNNLYFGSELKAIYPYGIKKEIDFDTLRLYVTLNYIPAPYSILKSVKKLLPGQTLTYKGDSIQLEYFYELKNQTQTTNLNYTDAKKELYSLMEQSVSDRLVSDVPLGTFLSGGIDSSIITTLASKQVQSLNTFSVGFKDNKFFDERAYARLVAEQCKTNHHEIELSNDDLLISLEELLDYTDEPFADSSALAVNALCKETKKHVTVCLSGDGADEVFGGYNKYMAEYQLQNLNFPGKLVSSFESLWDVLPKSRNNPLTNTFRKLDKFAKGANLDKESRYWKWCSLSSQELVNNLLSDKNPSEFDSRKNELIQYVSKEKGISDILLNDIHLVLPNDMLTKVDSMSMRNSLEVRVPFLDYRIVEFAKSLPDDYKVNKTLKKRIVQDSFRDILPEKLYNRPKHGFEVPMLDWLKNELDNRIRNEYFNKDFIQKQGIFNLEVIESLLEKLHSNNPEDSHANIWALVVFQHWYKKHIELT